MCFERRNTFIWNRSKCVLNWNINQLLCVDRNIFMNVSKEGSFIWAWEQAWKKLYLKIWSKKSKKNVTKTRFTLNFQLYFLCLMRGTVESIETYTKMQDFPFSGMWKSGFEKTFFIHYYRISFFFQFYMNGIFSY